MTISPTSPHTASPAYPPSAAATCAPGVHSAATSGVLFSRDIIQRQVAKIERIRCIGELDGFEGEARKRGLAPEEVTALAARRRSLIGGKR